MHRPRIPVSARILTATVLLVVIVVELTMLVPSDPIADSKGSWVQRQLTRLDQDPGLSKASRRSVQNLLVKHREDLERSPWNRLFLVVVLTCIVTTLINALVWTRVIKPLQTVLEDETRRKAEREPRLQSFRIITSS